MGALVKQAKLGDFGGRSLSVNFATAVFLGAEAQSCHERGALLTRWFAEKGTEAMSSATALSNDRMGSTAPAETIAEMQAVANELEAPQPNFFGGAPPPPPAGGANNQVKFHTVIGTVTFLPHDRPPFYLSCPVDVPDDGPRGGDGKMRSCNRKVEQNGDQWICSADHRCSQPKPRWIAQMSIADHTGSQYVSTFDDMGQKILGCDATEAARLWDLKDHDGDAAQKFEGVFTAAQFKRFRFRLKSKKEMWNDEERLKVSVMDVTPLEERFQTDGRSKMQEVMSSISNGIHAT